MLFHTTDPPLIRAGGRSFQLPFKKLFFCRSLVRGRKILFPFFLVRLSFFFFKPESEARGVEEKRKKKNKVERKRGYVNSDDTTILVASTVRAAALASILFFAHLYFSFRTVFTWSIEAKLR